MCFRPGLHPGTAGELTTLPQTCSRLGMGHLFPYPTPLGAFGVSILQPWALATRRLWHLGLGEGIAPNAPNIFL